MQDGGKMRTETFRCDKIKILLQWSRKVGWEDSSAVLSTGCSCGGLEFGSQHPRRVTHNSRWSSWHSARKLVHTPYTYMHMWFLKIVIKRWWTDCYIPAIHWILLNYKYRIGAGDVVYFRKLVQQAWDPGFVLQQNVKPGVMAQACNSSPRRVRTEPHSKCERQAWLGLETALRLRLFFLMTQLYFQHPFEHSGSKPTVTQPQGISYLLLHALHTRGPQTCMLAKAFIHIKFKKEKKFKR